MQCVGTLVDGELLACDADGRPDLPRLLRRHGGERSEDALDFGDLADRLRPIVAPAEFDDWRFRILGVGSAKHQNKTRKIGMWRNENAVALRFERDGLAFVFKRKAIRLGDEFEGATVGRVIGPGKVRGIFDVSRRLDFGRSRRRADRHL